MQGRTGQNVPRKIILPKIDDPASTLEVATEIVESNDSGAELAAFRRLRFYNVSMAIFHTIFAVLALVLGKHDLSLSLWEYRMGLNNNTEIDSFLAPTFRESALSIPLTFTTAFFFILSAFFHFGNGFLWNGCYNRCLSMKMVPSRWIEYFFSATTMIITIAYPAGIVQFTELFCIGALIATTMIFGHLTEVISRPSPDSDTWLLPLSARLAPHILGYIPQLAAWFVILFTFYSSTSGGDGEEGPPDFVFALVWLQVFLFFAFGFVQLVVLCRAPSKYIQGEYVYQTLSLLAKGMLGIMLLVNVLFFSNFECINEEFRNRNPGDCD